MKIRSREEVRPDGVYIVTYDEDTNTIVSEVKVEEALPVLVVRFTDTQGNPIEYISVGTQFKITVEVLTPDRSSLAPISGQYVVPYFSMDNIQQGAVLINLINGSGSKTLTLSKSGIFKIKPELIRSIDGRAIGDSIRVEGEIILPVVE